MAAVDGCTPAAAAGFDLLLVGYSSNSTSTENRLAIHITGAEGGVGSARCSGATPGRLAIKQPAIHAASRTPHVKHGRAWALHTWPPTCGITSKQLPCVRACGQPTHQHRRAKRARQFMRGNTERRVASVQGTTQQPHACADGQCGNRCARYESTHRDIALQCCVMACATCSATCFIDTTIGNSATARTKSA